MNSMKSQLLKTIHVIQVLSLLSIIGISQKQFVIGQPSTCFQQNQYPLFFHQPAADLQLYGLDIQDDGSNSIVFCGFQKTSFFGAPILKVVAGFMVNIEDESNMKWFAAYEYNPFQGIFTTSCQNIRVSQSRTVIAAFHTNQYRYLFYALNYDNGDVIRAKYLGKDSKYRKRQFIEITSIGEVFTIVEQESSGPNTWHTQVAKFSKNLENLLWVKEYSQGFGVNQIYMQSLLLYSDSEIWGSGLYQSSTLKQIFILKFSTANGQALQYGHFGNAPQPNLMSPTQLMTMDSGKNFILGCISDAQSSSNSLISFFIYNISSHSIIDYYYYMAANGENFQCAGALAAQDGYQIFFSNYDSPTQFVYTFSTSSGPPIAEHGWSTINMLVYQFFSYPHANTFFIFFKQRYNNWNIRRFFYVGYDTSGSDVYAVISYHYGDEYACTSLMYASGAPINPATLSARDGTLVSSSIDDSYVYNPGVTVSDFQTWKSGDNLVNYQKAVFAPGVPTCSLQMSSYVIDSTQNPLFNTTQAFICYISSTQPESACYLEVAQYSINSCFDNFTMRFSIEDISGTPTVIKAFTLKQYPPYKISLDASIFSYLNYNVQYSLVIKAWITLDQLEMARNENAVFKIIRALIVQESDVSSFLKFKDQKYIITDPAVLMISKVPQFFFLQGTLVTVVAIDFIFSSDGNIHT